MLSIHTINFEVVQFDFSKITAFLDKLSAAELKHNCKDTQSGARTFIVRITIKNYPMNGDDGLRRWLRRFDDSSKKGTGIAFNYEASWNGTVREKKMLNAYRHMYSWCAYMDMWSCQLEGTGKKQEQFKGLKIAVGVAERGMFFENS